MYPAVTISDRIALEDSVIPLASSIMTSTGEHISQISVQKGQLLQLGLASYNRSEPSQLNTSPFSANKPV
jgi:hypothetical protein